MIEPILTDTPATEKPELSVSPTECTLNDVRRPIKCNQAETIIHSTPPSSILITKDLLISLLWPSLCFS